MCALRSVYVGLAMLVGVAGVSSLPTVAAAQSSDGLVVAVIQSSEADGQTGRRVLSVEADIFSGDKIVTGPIGEAQIRFRDNTRLVVGPNSQMVIDAFVFNPDDSARQVTVNMTKGVFRFITGNSSSDAYKIITPTATIGTRGTEFDVDVDGTGATRVVNFTGATRICRRENPSGTDQNEQQCIETNTPCGLSVVRYGRGFQTYTDPADRNRELNWFFRYVRDQSKLLPDFQVNMGACTSTAYVAPNPTGGSPPDHPLPPPPPPCKHKCGPDKPHKPDYPHKPHKPGGEYGGWPKPHDERPPYHRSDNDDEDQS